MPVTGRPADSKRPVTRPLAQRPLVTVVGSANVDMILACANLPRAGETVLAADQRWGMGGKGANQAMAAARLGAAVSFIGCIGADDFGERVTEALTGEGIDVSGLRQVPDRATGIAVVAVDPLGDNLIIVQSGANAALAASDVTRAAALIQRAGIVVCQLETPLAIVEAVLDAARGHGTQVWLNPAPAQALPASWFPRLDLIVPNRAELETLTGIDVRTSAAMSRAVAELQRRGARTIVVTLGESGALIADGPGIRQHPALRVDAVDTTGAGDCFIGALAYACGTGRTLDDAVEFAQVAAALKVTRPGAQTSLPGEAEVRAFAASMGRSI